MGNSQSHSSEPFTENGVEKYAKFDDDWFAEGASRYAYRGKINSVSMGWFKRSERCVVKLYKEKYSARLKEDAWKADNRASLKAQETSVAFNVHYSGKSSARVEVLTPTISQVKTFAAHKQLVGDPVPKTIRGTHIGRTAKADVMVPEGASVAIERLLPGRYVHFLSNSSYVNPDVDTLVPEAFSHFTYHESEGEILVMDLQGVYNGKSYVFTDPSVHSMEKHGKKFGYYGPADLGVYGVMKFFLDHKCNRLCKGLLTPDTSGIPIEMRGDLIQAIKAIEARSSTTYTYELVVNSGLAAEKLQNLHTEIAQALTKSGSTIPETVC
ncbi:eukaryotic elongation factor 2 kinase-like [Patiria miniata]|uniref:Alpha-type protein kinase domain-containing protein n=1 Tax=Patiria miniata TaxID=46514 RepID=A0A914AFQ3_PATMI|nr:eukaryotic elongation factor 2 kinase-like [Patiria miniata]